MNDSCFLFSSGVHAPSPYLPHNTHRPSPARSNTKAPSKTAQPHGTMTKARLNRTEAVKSRKFQCSIPPDCRKAFGTKNDLMRHVHETHHESFDGIPPKTFVCPVTPCERHEPFYRKSNFRDHMRKYHPGLLDSAQTIEPETAFAQQSFIDEAAIGDGHANEDVEDLKMRLQEVEALKKNLTDKFQTLDSKVNTLKRQLASRKSGKLGRRTGLG